MGTNKAEEYVQKFIDSHEPDTFVKNENGIYLYSAGHSSINLKIFMIYLLEDYIEDRQSEIDELTNEVERLRKEREWINLIDLKPHSYKRGNWDGLMSNELLLIDDKNVPHIGVCYQGTIDGNEFCEFYDYNDFEIKNVIKYKPINK